jgi:ABC-2 type transport system permease protein
MSDAATMVGRCVRLSTRNLDATMTALFLPVMLMLLFVYLFGGAIDTGTKYSPTWFPA